MKKLELQGLGTTLMGVWTVDGVMAGVRPWRCSEWDLVSEFLPLHVHLPAPQKWVRGEVREGPLAASLPDLPLSV